MNLYLNSLLKCFSHNSKREIGKNTFQTNTLFPFQYNICSSSIFKAILFTSRLCMRKLFSVPTAKRSKKYSQPTLFPRSLFFFTAPLEEGRCCDGLFSNVRECFELCLICERHEFWSCFCFVEMSQSLIEFAILIIFFVFVYVKIRPPTR